MPAGGRRSSCPAAMDLLERLEPAAPRRPGADPRRRDGHRHARAGRRGTLAGGDRRRHRRLVRDGRRGRGGTGSAPRSRPRAHRFDGRRSPRPTICPSPMPRSTPRCRRSCSSSSRTATAPCARSAARSVRVRRWRSSRGCATRPSGARTRSSTRSSTNSGSIRPTTTRTIRPTTAPTRAIPASVKALVGELRRAGFRAVDGAVGDARDRLRPRRLHRLPDRIRRSDPVRRPRTGRDATARSSRSASDWSRSTRPSCRCRPRSSTRWLAAQAERLAGP